MYGLHQHGSLPKAPHRDNNANHHRQETGYSVEDGGMIPLEGRQDYDYNNDEEAVGQLQVAHHRRLQQQQQRGSHHRRHHHPQPEYPPSATGPHPQTPRSFQLRPCYQNDTLLRHRTTIAPAAVAAVGIIGSSSDAVEQHIDAILKQNYESKKEQYPRNASRLKKKNAFGGSNNNNGLVTAGLGLDDEERFRLLCRRDSNSTISTDAETPESSMFFSGISGPAGPESSLVSTGTNGELLPFEICFLQQQNEQHKPHDGEPHSNRHHPAVTPKSTKKTRRVGLQEEQQDRSIKKKTSKHEDILDDEDDDNDQDPLGNLPAVIQRAKNLLLVPTDTSQHRRKLSNTKKDASLVQEFFFGEGEDDKNKKKVDNDTTSYDLSNHHQLEEEAKEIVFVPHPFATPENNCDPFSSPCPSPAVRRQYSLTRSARKSHHDQKRGDHGFGKDPRDDDDLLPLPTSLTTLRRGPSVGLPTPTCNTTSSSRFILKEQQTRTQSNIHKNDDESSHPRAPSRGASGASSSNPNAPEGPSNILDGRKTRGSLSSENHHHHTRPSGPKNQLKNHLRRPTSRSEVQDSSYTTRFEI